MLVPSGIGENEAITKAQKMPDVDKWILGRKVAKIIYIPNRIINFVMV